MKKIINLLIVLITLVSCKNIVSGDGINNQARLEYVTEFTNGNYTDKIAVSDEYILANDSSDGLALYYEPNTSSIAFLHNLYRDSDAIFFFQNRFIFYSWGELHYYRITGSNDSEYISSYSIENIKKIEMYGNDFFLLADNGTVSRIRLDDETFSLISEYPLSDAANDMVLVYPVLAVIDDFFINIFDISDSDFLTLDHTTALVGAKAIDGYNDNLFIVTDIGIKHFTLSDDNIPIENNTHIVSNDYTKIVVNYPLIYCSNRSMGLDLYTISGESLDYLENYDTGGTVEDFAVKGSYVYLASGYNGIIKLQYSYY